MAVCSTADGPEHASPGAQDMRHWIDGFLGGGRAAIECRLDWGLRDRRRTRTLGLARRLSARALGAVAAVLATVSLLESFAIPWRFGVLGCAPTTTLPSTFGAASAGRCGASTGAASLARVAAGRRRVRRRLRFVLRGDYHGRSGRLGQRPVVRLRRGVATSPRFGRSIGFLAAHSPRVQSTCIRLRRGLRRFPSALGDRLASAGTHSPQVQWTKPSACSAGCDVSRPALGDRVASLGLTRHGCNPACPPPTRVATSPVRFERPTGFLAAHSPPSATVARAVRFSAAAAAIFPVGVPVGRSRGFAASVSSRSWPPRPRARC